MQAGDAEGMRRWQLSLIAAAAFLVYTNCLTGVFLIDDTAAIVENADVTGVRPIDELWWNDYWGNGMHDVGSHKSYRPLVILTFRLTYHLWRDWTFPYHVTNAILHVIATCMFALVCDKLVFRSRDDVMGWSHGPFVAGLLFATHPVHVEAVTGVVGRAETLSAMLVFATILVYDKSYNSGNNTRQNTENEVPDDPTARKSVDDDGEISRNAEKRDTSIRRRKRTNVLTSSESNEDENEFGMNLIEVEIADTLPEESWIRSIGITLVTIFLGFAAMLCKESGITVLGIMVLFEIVYRAEKSFCKSQPLEFICRSRFAAKIILITASSLAILYFRLFMNRFEPPKFGKMDNPAANSDSTLTRFLTYSALPWINLWILIYPKFLCWDWAYGTIPLFTSIADTRNIFTLIFYASLLSTIIYTVHCMCAKSKDFRPLAISLSLTIIPYIPMSNLFFPVGFTVAERCLYLPSAGFVIFITILWCKAVTRFPDYKRYLQAFLGIVLTLYAARTLLRNRDWLNHTNLSREAYATNPQNARVVSSFADHLHYRDDNLDKAMVLYKRAIQLYPKYSDAYAGLGHIYARKGTPDNMVLAEKHYRRGIELEPTQQTTYYRLAELYTAQKKWEDLANIVILATRTLGRYRIVAIAHFSNILKDAGQLKLAKRVIEQLLCRVCDNDPACVVPNLNKCGTDSLTSLNIYMATEWKLGNKDRTYEILKVNTGLRGDDFEEKRKALFPTK